MYMYIYTRSASVLYMRRAGKYCQPIYSYARGVDL